MIFLLFFLSIVLLHAIHGISSINENRISYYCWKGEKEHDFITEQHIHISDLRSNHRVCCCHLRGVHGTGISRRPHDWHGPRKTEPGPDFECDLFYSAEYRYSARRDCTLRKPRNTMAMAAAFRNQSCIMKLRWLRLPRNSQDFQNPRISTATPSDTWYESLRSRSRVFRSVRMS